MMTYMPRYSTDRTVNDFIAFLLRANERPNPFNPNNTGHLIDAAGVVNVVRNCLGEDAARTVRIWIH
jgi:hypothetical protein